MTAGYLDGLMVGPEGPAGTPGAGYNAVRSLAGATTLTAGDFHVADLTSGTYAVTFPAASSVVAGTPIGIENINDGGTRVLNFIPTGGDVVEGATDGMLPGDGNGQWTSDGSATWYRSAGASIPVVIAGAALLVDVTLVAGAGSTNTFKDLSSATIFGVYLKTPHTAVGVPAPSISGTSIAITSYTAGAIQAATDASVWRVVVLGAK